MRILVALLILAIAAICHAQQLKGSDDMLISPIIEQQILPAPTIILAGEDYSDNNDGTTTMVNIDDDEDMAAAATADPYAVDGVDIAGLEAEKSDAINGLPVSFHGESDEAIAETINGIADDQDYDGVDNIDLDGINIDTITDDTNNGANDEHLDALDEDGADADLQGIAEEDGAASMDEDTEGATIDNENDNDDGKDDDDKDGDDEGNDINSVDDMAAAYNGVVTDDTTTDSSSTTDPQLGTADIGNSDDGTDGSISFTHELPTDLQGGSSEMIVPRWKRKLGKLKSVDIKLVGRMVGTTGGFGSGNSQVRRSLSIIGDANIIVKGPSKFGRLRHFLRRLRRLHRLSGGIGSQWSQFRIRRALRRARLAAFRLAKLRRSSLLDLSTHDLLNNQFMKSLILGKYQKKGMKLFIGSGKLAFVISKNIVPPTKVDNVESDTQDITKDLSLGGHLQVTYHFKKHHKGAKLRLLHKLIKYLRLPSLTRMRLLRLHQFFVMHRLEAKLRALKVRMLTRAIIACKRLQLIKEMMKNNNRIMMTSKVVTPQTQRRNRHWVTDRLMDPKIHSIRPRFLRRQSRLRLTDAIKDTFPIRSHNLRRSFHRSLATSHLRQPITTTSSPSSALPLVTRHTTGVTGTSTDVDSDSDSESFTSE